MLFIEPHVFSWIRKNVSHVDLDVQQAVVFYHEEKMIYFTTAKDAPSYFELVKLDLALNQTVSYTMKDMREAFDETIKHKHICSDRSLPIDTRTAHSWKAAEAMVYLLQKGVLAKLSPLPRTQIIHFYKVNGSVRWDYLIR